METSDVLMFAFWILWGLTVPAYVIVQIIVLVRAAGWSRWIAGLPLVVMAPMYVLFAIGLSQGGDNNLSWLLPILSSPPALLYVVIVALFVRPAAKHAPPVT
jgi:hypothetical protein